MQSDVNVLYRYDMDVYWEAYATVPAASVTLWSFKIIRETDKSYMIIAHGKPTWVRKSQDGKRFAYKYKMHALNSLLVRVHRRMQHAMNDLAKAEAAMRHVSHAGFNRVALSMAPLPR